VPGGGRPAEIRQGVAVDARLECAYEPPGGSSDDEGSWA
jgi:hypothetical protein